MPDQQGASSRPAITVTGLERHFGERRALADVSFSAAPGERLAVIGPNGAGKTTLLSIIAGTLKPDGGSVELAAARSASSRSSRRSTGS